MCSSQNCNEMSAVIPVVQSRRLRLGEVRWLLQGHHMKTGPRNQVLWHVLPLPNLSSILFMFFPSSSSSCFSSPSASPLLSTVSSFFPPALSCLSLYLLNTQSPWGHAIFPPPGELTTIPCCDLPLLSRLCRKKSLSLAARWGWATWAAGPLATNLSWGSASPTRPSPSTSWRCTSW